MFLKSLKNLKNLAGRVIFLRVDFNVPIKNGRVQEDYKIVTGLKTIQFLQSQGARLIIATHLGEPDGKRVATYSVKPVAKRLQVLLKSSVKFYSETFSPRVKAAVDRLKNGEIIFLENLRFNPGETSNDQDFSKKLASLADVYINDALAVSHRPHASVAGIRQFLPSYAGFQLEAEVQAFTRVLHPQKPLVIIMGGAKISTKLPLIEKLYPRSAQILIGGALANNFFKFKKFEIGRSLYDQDSFREIKSLFRGQKLAAKIILPLDVIVQTKDGRALVKELDAVHRSEIILDIGPRTVSNYAKYIKSAKTLVWNGPMGKFEEKSFQFGTLAIARLIAERSTGRAYGLVGGGETIEALKLTKMTEHVDWISTAGGAMLTYLSGGQMPGLEKIIMKKKS